MRTLLGRIRNTNRIIALLVVAMTLVVLSGCIPLPPEATPASTLAPTATPTRTPEPLIPTPLPPSPTPRPAATARATATSQQTAEPTATAQPEATAAPTATAGLEMTETQPTPVSWPARSPSDKSRIGVGVPEGEIDDYDWGDALPGWYLDWWTALQPRLPSDIRFAQMVFVNGDEYQPELAAIDAIARANPGSLWLIGNEPDVAWQGNATPEQYAATYGALYPAIKEADPSAQIAVGGVSQPTPLRLEYLDRILSAYEVQFKEPMPVDVWNVHAFILREERDSWGVGIPPGMDVDQGTLYEIEDHADMEIFRRQVEDFRRWMAEKGFRDKPLVVSEYGILMPDSYGFPSETVSQFMLDTFDYLLTARDPETGYPADDDRLVQAFCWYSAADRTYPTPNLFDPETRAVTPLGEVFRAYVAGLP